MRGTSRSPQAREPVAEPRPDRAAGDRRAAPAAIVRPPWRRSSARPASSAVGRRRRPAGAGPAARSASRPDAVTVAGTVGRARRRARLRRPRPPVVGTSDRRRSCAHRHARRGDGPDTRRRSSRFGALLDSTMDRVADGAIFGALACWLATTGDQLRALAAALVCLVAGQVVSYVKARAEALGFTCNVGIAERTERLHPRRRRRPADRLRRAVGAGRRAVGARGALGVHRRRSGSLHVLPRRPGAGPCRRAARGEPDAPGRSEQRRARRAAELGVRGRLAVGAGAAPAGAAWALLPGRRRPGRPAARARAPSGWRANLRRVVGPELPEAELDALVAAGCARTPGTGWRRSGCPRCRGRRSCAASGWSADSCSADAVDGRYRRGGRAAARGQLGRRRGLGRGQRLAASPRSPSGSSPRALYQRFLAFRRGARHGDHPD